VVNKTLLFISLAWLGASLAVMNTMAIFGWVMASTQLIRRIHEAQSDEKTT